MKTYNNTPNIALTGFSAIVMVIILMVVGLVVLTGFNLLINSWQKTATMENIYYQRVNNASSSLTWAFHQKWGVPTTNWQCLSESTYQLKACIKKSLSKIDNYVLVRGESEKFYLYTLTHFDKNKLVFEKGHWLDYCPEKKIRDCE